MYITPGSTYRFTFLEPFVGLGYTEESPSNGYYTVIEQLTFEQLLSRGIDLVPTLYEYVGLGETDYQAAKSTFVGVVFYALKNVYTDVVIYMPLISIDGVPRSDIKNYNKLLLGTRVGFIDDATDLTEIIALVRGILTYKYGIAVAEDDVQLATYDTQYMTTAEYEALIATREALKGTGAPTELAGEALPVNLWSIIQQLKTEKATLQSRVAALEAHILTLVGGPS